MEFEIPRNSFTGLRLAYLPISHISATSQSLVLGRYPHIWLDEETTGLLSGTVRSAKSKVRRAFDDSIAIFSQSHLDNKRTYNRYLRKVEQTLGDFRAQMMDPDLADESEDVDETAEAYSGMPDIYPTDSDISGSNSRFLNPRNIPGASGSLQSHHFDDETLDPLDSRSELNVKFKPNTNYSYTDIESKLRDRKKSSSSRSKSKIELANPEPIIGYTAEPAVVDKEHHNFTKRLRKFASLSTGKARRKTRDWTSKVYKSVIKSYEVGDIVLQEKVLVMVKETINVTNVDKLEHVEACDTKVKERWKQYNVILRKVDDEMIALQLYKLETGKRQKSENIDNLKPEYEFELSLKIGANLYSPFDKSISVTLPKSNWCLIYIFKFHSQAKSIRWLYFLKQVIGDEISVDFSIQIPDIDITLDLKLPESIVLELFSGLDSMRVMPLENDYGVTHTQLIEYILDFIFERAKCSKHEKVLNWFHNVQRPWFCFRNYDYLEWIFDDSEHFFILNAMLKGSFQLELRDTVAESRFVELENKVIEEPVPVEGFLSRLTDVGGHEQNIIKTFYKISYFNTNNHLLFFTKYYRSLPPKLDKSDVDIQLKSTYPVDEHNHVNWMNKSEKFEYCDKLSLEEFQRKSQLVVRADSVIDLTQVMSIEPVDISTIKLAHKILLGVLWYGDSNLIHDEFIMDSVFEIKMLNNSRIRLQAPNRRIRDEWISNLTHLKNYWTCKNKKHMEKLLKTREHNTNALRIDEFTDSNINLENTVGVLKRSIADPSVHPIDNIAVSGAVLMSGYLYQKYKKHSNFNQYYVVLGSGCLIFYSMYRRSSITGEWKKAPYFQHFLTVSLAECYVYWGNLTELDLINEHQTVDSSHVGKQTLPRIYIDGWKSQEEESTRCFTIWFGRKRDSRLNNNAGGPKNPNLLKIIKKLGITGHSIVLMARSRQERESWVARIDTEIDRYSKLSGL